MQSSLNIERFIEIINNDNSLTVVSLFLVLPLILAVSTLLILSLGSRHLEGVYPSPPPLMLASVVFSSGRLLL